MNAESQQRSAAGMQPFTERTTSELLKAHLCDVAETCSRGPDPAINILGYETLNFRVKSSVSQSNT